MKANWQTKKLGDICSVFTDGNWIESKDQSPEGIRLIQTGNIGNGIFKNRAGKARYISEKTFKKLKCTEIFKGDILISRLPDPVGRSCIIPKTKEKMITAVDCSIIRLKKEILSKFFNYFTQSYTYLNDVEQLTSGTTRKRISRKNLGLIQIPFPPLPEQKRIVKILDEVFEKVAQAKENAEKNLKNSRELFESYLQNIFANPSSARASAGKPGEDWEDCVLNDYVKFIDYRGRTPKKTETGIRLITAKNIKMGYLQIHPEEFINPNDYEGWMTRGIPKKGDVLFTTEAPLANVAQLDTDEKVAFAQRTIIFQPNQNKLEQAFLKYLLLSRPIQIKIIEKGTGATVKGIKARLLKNIPISFPSLPIQKSIVAQLDKLSAKTKKLEDIYKQKIADLEELKKSVLKKAFAGEL
ncbi:MAG: restriction endonuclease subunit S [Patescibacteria group bacterium]